MLIVEEHPVNVEYLLENGFWNSDDEIPFSNEYVLNSYGNAMKGQIVDGKCQGICVKISDYSGNIYYAPMIDDLLNGLVIVYE